MIYSLEAGLTWLRKIVSAVEPAIAVISAKTEVFNQ
jgi:hypothetical protein